MHTYVRLHLVGLAIIVCATVATSLPRFAVLTGMKCQSCHVNPAGGGMRQQFGAKFGREDLPVPEWQTEGGDLNTLVRDVVGIGADFRTLYFVRQVPDSAGTQVEDTFWQMQGDLYLNFRLGSKANLYLKKGLSHGFEIFGQLNILPMKGYLKIGKFLPDYGLRLDDHTAYVRTYTGFSPEFGSPELTGAEAAISPGACALTVGIYNSSTTDGFSTAGNRKALLARAEGWWRLSEGITAMAGGNVFRRDTDAGATESLYGGFGGFGIDPLTLTGEVDYIKKSDASGTMTGVALYGEASYTISPGIDLKAGYEFYDEDIDLKTGSKNRYSFGVEFFPLSGVEVRPVYRIQHEDPDDTPNNEFYLLFHIYI